jgi:hypothetical protein
MFRIARKSALLVALSFGAYLAGSPRVVKNGVVDITTLWNEPRDIQSRDLFYGAGGKKNAPRSTEFTFVEEDTDGTQPKYNVTDADGVKWKIKLGKEAKPETAASRFVWAAGFYAREYYFVPSVRVANLPDDLHRGKKHIGPGGSMQNVRLMRMPDDRKKVGEWKWRESPFLGTREFNGLRVVMALLNSWDLKDGNNSIYEDASGRREYMVSDLGMAFGTAGLTWKPKKWRGRLESYQRSKFIKSATPELVTFAAPARPAIAGAIAPGNFYRRIKMRWIAKEIPRQHARWMGEVLGRLSPAQIRDAFRGSGFSAEEVEGFARVVEGRIAELRAL